MALARGRLLQLPPLLRVSVVQRRQLRRALRLERRRLRRLRRRLPLVLALQRTMSDLAAAGFPNSKGNLIWDLIKPVSTLALNFNKIRRINNTTQTTPYLGRVAGSAYTVNLYPIPTAPLYPKSPVRGNRSLQSLTCSDAVAAVRAAARAASAAAASRSSAARSSCMMRRFHPPPHAHTEPSSIHPVEHTRKSHTIYTHHSLLARRAERAPRSPLSCQGGRYGQGSLR